MSSGELVPVVLFPRYSTFAGVNTFTTVAMDVTQYQSAILNVWRGVLLGTTPTYDISFQESTDQDNWTTCANGSGGDPGQDTEAQYTPTLTKRWFRVQLLLGGTDPVITTWALGFLELRLS
jgi:hypothetical protein